MALPFPKNGTACKRLRKTNRPGTGSIPLDMTLKILFRSAVRDQHDLCLHQHVFGEFSSKTEWLAN